jgi:hypothetical protein
MGLALSCAQLLCFLTVLVLGCGIVDGDQRPDRAAVSPHPRVVAGTPGAAKE